MSFKTVTFRIPRDSELFRRLQALVQGQEVPWSKAVLRELENTQQELPLQQGGQEEVERLQGTLEEQSGEIARLQGTLEEQSGEIARLQGSLDESHDKIPRLQDELEEQLGEIGKLRSKVRDLRGALQGTGSLRKENSSLREKLKKSEEFSVALLTALIKMKVKG